MIPDRISYLLGSEERVRMLEVLEDDRMRQCDVARRCSLPQSTAHRNLEGLVDRDWVAEREEGYTLTVAGRRMLEAYRTFESEVTEIAEHEAFLRCCDRFDPEIPASALWAGETTVATEANPHAAAMEMAALIRSHAGTDLRIATGTISPITNRAGWDAVEAGSNVQSLLGEDAFEAFRDHYGETAAEADGYDRIDIRAVDGSVEFGLVLCGDEVGVSVPGATDGIEACHRSSHPELRSWGEAVHERLLARATPVAELAETSAEAD
jgi:predicted transcriptional regulator